MTVPLLGSDAAKARNQARQAEQVPEVIEAVTAFTVYVTPDGRFLPEFSLDTAITTQRPPTRHDVLAGCAVVAHDISAQMQIEGTTASVLGNFARMQGDPNYHAMLEQARTQAEAAMNAAAAGGAK